MIGCSQSCIDCATCYLCIWVIKEQLHGRLKGNPIGCSFHEDARHQDLAMSLGACNDFHCISAKKPERWLVMDVCDT